MVRLGFRLISFEHSPILLSYIDINTYIIYLNNINISVNTKMRDLYIFMYSYL